MLAHLARPATAALFCLVAFAAPLAQDTQTTPTADARSAADRGTELFHRGEFAAALAEFDTALAGGVVDGRTLFRAGFSQQMSRKPRDQVQQTLSRALQALDQSVNRAPETATLTDWAYMAMTYSGLGDRGTARQTAIGGIKSYREGRFGGVTELAAEAAYHLGRLAGLAGDDVLQRNAFDRATKAGENWPETHPDPLGRALADLGQLDLADGAFENARGHLARALELVPARRLPGVRFNLAVALYRLGRYPEAELEWDRVRLEDPVQAPQAGYARQLMRTLDQLPLLLDDTEPLTDLSTFNQADLEMRLLNLAAELGEVSGKLPPEAIQLGYFKRTPGGKSSGQRLQMQRFRDLKARVAWVAAEYAARGFLLREFAFQNGLQGALRPWGRLPRNREPGTVSDNLRDRLPVWITDEDIAAEEARREEVKQSRRERNAERGGKRGKRGKKQTSQEDSGGN